MDECIHVASFLSRDVLLDIEVLYLTAKMHGQARMIKFSKGGNTTATR